MVTCKTADTGDNNTSTEHDIEFGTAQGSCLGPLIFLIFCNDLQYHLIFLECIQFADDTTLYVTHKSIEYIRFCLEHDLFILQDWFRANKLTLNVSKSVSILFGKHSNLELRVKIGQEVYSTGTTYEIPWSLDRPQAQLERTHQQTTSKIETQDQPPTCW